MIYKATLPVENVWTEKEFTFTAPNSGQYLTVMVDSGEASSTWELLDDVKFIGKSTGILQLAANTFIYPNPAHDAISIVSDVPYREMKIYNAIGQLICDRINENGDELKTLDLSSFANGIYTLEFLDQKNQVIERKKIMKAN